MTNFGKSSGTVIINIAGNNNRIFIYADSLLTGTISVRDSLGTSLWQKSGCDSNDLIFALEIAKRGIQTGIFETD